MVAITDTTPHRDVTIQGLTFSYPAPYTAGPHELTEGEASQLNQVLGENLRNNFAAKIRSHIEDYRKANNLPEDQEIGADVLDKDTLDHEFAELAVKYEFGVRQASGAPRTPSDPIMKEAVLIARSRVRDALKKKGIQMDTVSKEQMHAFVQQVLEKYPDIREEAKRRVEASASIAIDGLEL